MPSPSVLPGNNPAATPSLFIQLLTATLVAFILVCGGCDVILGSGQVGSNAKPHFTTGVSLPLGK